MQKKSKIILTIVGSLTAIYLYTHSDILLPFGHSKDKAPVVTVAKAQQKTIAIPLQAVGTVQAYSTVQVKSLVDGELLNTGFHEGDTVKKGQLLFAIDPRPFSDQLEQAQASLAKDQAQLDNANSQIQRSQPLLTKGFISAQDFEQLQANAKRFVAAVASDNAAVNNAQLQLSYANITSPIDGRTGDLEVYPGNIIKSAGNTTLVTITQMNPIYVTFSVPQQYLPNLQTQQNKKPVTVTANVGNNTETGELTFINNTIDPTTGTIQLKATFTNAQQNLWPGQFVNVSLPATVVPNAILVPSSAVQVGQNGAYVYVLQKDKTVSYRPIKIGPLTGDQTVVLQGLQLGEAVVVDGQMRLTDGIKVRVEK